MPNVPDWLQVQYCSSPKSLETFALMVSIQAWVIRIWSRVIRASDEAPGFFYRYAKWLDFLTEASLTSFLISFSKTTQFFFSPSTNFPKRGNQNFFFNLESISGQTDDISQQTENKNNYREISSGDRNRKTGGIFFSVDRTQSPKMMVILEARVAIIFVFSVSESESVELQLSLRHNLSLYFASLRSRIRCHSKLQVGEWTRFDRRIYGYWFLMTWILIGV